MAKHRATTVSPVKKLANTVKETALDLRYGKKNYFSGRRSNEATPVTIVK